MIDTEYIKSIKLLERKEAKEELAKYASQFGIKVKKSSSIDTMISHIDSEMKKLYNEPMPDENSGMTISEIIMATGDNKVHEIFETVPVPISEAEFKTENDKVKKSNIFSPTISLIGKQPGFCTLQWWIYEWIAKTPEWKSIPEKCPHYNSLSILHSLIYYIERDGRVVIRETRNSKFITLN